MLDWLKRFFGVATTTVASAPLMGIPGAAEAIAVTIGKSIDAKTEVDRVKTMRGIADELHKNADIIAKGIAEARAESPMKKATHIILPPAVALFALLALAGCATSARPERDTVTATGNVGRLMRHPEFKAAAVAAPNFTQDCLDTSNNLEGMLQTERARSNQVR